MIIIVGENDHADMAIRRTFDLTRSASATSTPKTPSPPLASSSV